jgi:hypothetical protein
MGTSAGSLVNVDGVSGWPLQMEVYILLLVMDQYPPFILSDSSLRMNGGGPSV